MTSKIFTHTWHSEVKHYNRHDNHGTSTKNKDNSQVTAEQLDKELDEYFKKKGNTF